MHALNPFRWLLPLLLGLAGPAQAQTDPLPSWNDGASKARIVAFAPAVASRRAQSCWALGLHDSTSPTVSSLVGDRRNEFGRRLESRP